MKPVGYCYLAEKLKRKGYKFIWPRSETYSIEMGRSKVIKQGGRVRRQLRIKSAPVTDLEHLRYGLSHEGVNVQLKILLFKETSRAEIEAFILSGLSSKYNRIIWFFYEELTKETLNIADAQVGRYAPLLDEDKYFTGTSKRNKRYKIDDNRMGHSPLTPLIEKTQIPKPFDLKNKAKKLIDQYDLELVQKSVNFLYAKETKKSNEIEKEHPDKKREARLIGLLKKANEIEKIDESMICELQNAIVDQRYAVTSYRDFQTYVGSTDLFGNEIVHYICPKGEDNKNLMKIFEALCRDIMEDDLVHPVIAATIISFLFVYIHPLEDGNGRIHRFLIHYVLSKKNATPKGVIFPVSVVIASNLGKYDNALESFSKDLVPLIDYTLDDKGEMTILDKETSHLYYGIDLTEQSDFLFWALEETLVNDFKKELEYLKIFTYSVSEIRKVVDIPDRRLNNLINIVISNNGKLSKKKRQTHYSELRDDEVAKIEKIIGSQL